MNGKTGNISHRASQSKEENIKLIKAWDLILSDISYSNEIHLFHQCFLCPQYMPGPVQCQGLDHLPLFLSSLFEGVSLSMSLCVREWQYLLCNTWTTGETFWHVQSEPAASCSAECGYSHCSLWKTFFSVVLLLLQRTMLAHFFLHSQLLPITHHYKERPKKRHSGEILFPFHFSLRKKNLYWDRGKNHF